MSVVSKLGGFAAGLAVLFGGAALAGSAVGPLHDQSPTADTQDEHGMGMGDEKSAPQAIRGLAVSEGGLTLRLARTTAAPGRRFTLAFRIVDRAGETVRNFDVRAHRRETPGSDTKRMHLIVVRRDMTGFQHLHPARASAGTWSVPVTLRNAGSYRVFADFSTKGKAYTLADDVTVDGTVRSRPLPAAAGAVEVDGLRVALAKRGGALAFDVTRDGRPVAVRDYLGAKGHLVALRQGDLAFLHVHPDEDRLRFMAEFPTPGSYRLFLQFKTDDGRIHTAAFTQEVSR